MITTLCVTARDVTLLQQVRDFQKENSSKLQQLHDAEAHFDQHLSEFMLVVKRALPQKVTRLASLKEFQTNMTMAMGTDPKGMDFVKHYFNTLDLLRTMLAQAEVNIHLPLTLIPARCETEKQRELKGQMKSACVEMQKLLKPTASLKEAYCKEWEGKIMARERTLFMGLISLIPLGVEKVTDVDQYLDEYITSFPSLS